MTSVSTAQPGIMGPVWVGSPTMTPDEHGKTLLGTIGAVSPPTDGSGMFSRRDAGTRLAAGDAIAAVRVAKELSTTHAGVPMMVGHTDAGYYAFEVGTDWSNDAGSVHEWHPLTLDPKAQFLFADPEIIALVSPEVVVQNPHARTS